MIATNIKKGATEKPDSKNIMWRASGIDKNI